MLTKKRFLSVILAMTLTISTGLFSGFKSTQTSSKKLVGAPVTLKYLSSQDNFDPMKDFTRKLILDTINYDVQPEMGIDDDKVNLIMVSGQEYDMIKIYNLNLLGTYINNKVIYPLNDLIDKYGPNLKKAFTKEEW
ncbi:MAG: hypothetical protein H7Y18_04770, partial [Clostridiaceae bacterium]|nr:hypothetical protein [Clostridiaceae bacterium]